MGGAVSQAGFSEALFLCQIILLLVFGRLLGEAMLRIGQPAVIGQLIAGILLGPSILGELWPQLQHTIFPPNREQKAMIEAVSQLGILMLLLLTGMETDLSVVRKSRGTALSVSFTGIAIPFVCGFAIGELLPNTMLPHPEQRLITSLFLGTALSISSVKIVAMVVREMDFMRRTDCHFGDYRRHHLLDHHGRDIRSCASRRDRPPLSHSEYCRDRAVPAREFYRRAATGVLADSMG